MNKTPATGHAPGTGCGRCGFGGLLVVLVTCLLLPAPVFSMEPVTASLSTQDADRLARLLKQTGYRPAERELETRYLAQASPGLRGLLLDGASDNTAGAAAGLQRALRVQRYAYRHAIELCLPVARGLAGRADRWQQEVAAALAIETPDAAPVPIDVVFGDGRSGGTVRDGRIVLALEVQCRFASTAEEAALVLEASVRHEAVHRHQLALQQPTARNSLLRQAMIEGLAVWVTEQQLGTTPPQAQERGRYARRHEPALWSAFSRDMQGSALGHWMYGPGRPGEPADLGYWLGQQIVAAYLAAQPEQGHAQAVRALLLLENPTRLLRDSGYGPASPACCG